MAPVPPSRASRHRAANQEPYSGVRLRKILVAVCFARCEVRGGQVRGWEKFWSDFEKQVIKRSRAGAMPTDTQV